MVHMLSNDEIDALKKEGKLQPYPAPIESVHQDNGLFEDIWTREARTNHDSRPSRVGHLNNVT